MSKQLGFASGSRWTATLGESWFCDLVDGIKMDIGKLPAPRVQSRRAWSSRRKCSRAPGSSVSCRTLVSGMVDRRLVGVFFWWSSCIRCWGRLDETAVSRVHFWLARAPSQARGGLRAAAFVCPWRRRRRPNPHIDSLSSPLTRPPLYPFPPLKLLACGHLDTITRHVRA